MNNNSKKTRQSITTKITMGFIIVIFIVGIIVFWGYSYYINNFLKQDQIALAGNCARTAANLLYKAPLDQFVKKGKNNLYNTYASALSIICNNFNLKYLYVYIPNFKNNTLKMVFDLDGNSTNNLAGRDLGAVVLWKITPAEVNTFYNANDSLSTETNNEFGHVITRYAAVYNEYHQPIALVGVDLSFDNLNALVRTRFLSSLIFIVLGLSIIYFMLIAYIKYVLIKPVTLISERMENFIDENKPGYEPLKLDSNDELSSMADSFNRMAADMNAYIKKLSETQMETIFSLAKLAQSRDDDTGKHLDRVQQYCYILAEKAFQDSPYSNLIDDDFIKNIVNASALHDIGKVGISDSILLKPGKLTPEEFNEIKKHTTIGYQTLKEVHSKFGQNSFIEMGMLIANYHHERWDGNGYPEGLKEKEIPLAARIMSIADVYDALSTRRAYKDAFPQEKCIEIIKEGRGTQFDPILVDIFLEVTDSFYSVRKECED